MDLESTLELESFNSDCTSNNANNNDQLNGSMTKSLSHEPSCKRLKRCSALLRRSITNFNGYHGRSNGGNGVTVNSNIITRTEESAVQRNLNDGFEKAFDSIQLSSGPRLTPPIVILTDLTSKCIRSRRLI